MKKHDVFFQVCMLALFTVLSYIVYLQVPDAPKAHLDIDSKAYLDHARLLFKHNSFAWPGEGRPYYVLGYPFLMGIVYKVVGSESVDSVIFLQWILACLTGLLMYAITRRLLAARRDGAIKAARLALFFFCCNIGFLTFVQFILTEITLVFFLTVFLWYALRFVQDERWGDAGGAGFFLGLSVLIKPAGLYFVLPMLCLGAARIALHRRTWTAPVFYGLIFLSAYAVPIGLYVVHNAIVFHEPYLSKLGEENLYYWFYPHLRSARTGMPVDWERLQLIRLDRASVRELFWRDCREHPWLCVRMWVFNMMKTVGGLLSTNLKVLVEPLVSGGDLSFFKTDGSLLTRFRRYIEGGVTLRWVAFVAYGEALWSIIRIPCMLAGCGALMLYDPWSASMVLLYLLYFIGITGHDGCSRFRMMVEVPIMMLTAIGIVAMVDAVRVGRRDG